MTDKNDANDQYEDILVAITFPELDNTSFLEGKTINIKELFDINPTCDINGAEFEGSFVETFGTQLYYTDDKYTHPNFIGMSTHKLEFKIKSPGNISGINTTGMNPPSKEGTENLLIQPDINNQN